MKKISSIEVGQTNKGAAHLRADASAKAVNPELVDAINQTFALFRVNFHNQYYKAFPDENILRQVKKLWLSSLSKFSESSILNASRSVIEEQEFLPTLHQMMTACSRHAHNLPTAYQAYKEACNAPSPKAQFKWSHQAVYLAGAATGWYFLATTAEQFAQKSFRQNYEQIIRKLNQGWRPELPKLEVSTETSERLLKSKDARKKLKGLFEELGM